MAVALYAPAIALTQGNTIFYMLIYSVIKVIKDKELTLSRQVAGKK